MKTILLTGSFNPISKGHYLIMKQTIEAMHADKGVFIITNQDYLISKNILKQKDKTGFILSEETRKEMIESLKKENPNIYFGGAELGGTTPSTYKTIKRYHKKHPDEELFLLEGADKLSNTGHWTDIDLLMDIINLVVFERDDFDRSQLETIIENDAFLTLRKNQITILPKLTIPKISSTEIRRRFFAGEDYHDLMNDGPYQVLSKFKKEDFHPVDFQTFVSTTIHYGGRFGQNAARKLIYKENIRIMKEEWNEKVFGKKQDFFDNTIYYNQPFDVSNLPKLYSTETDCVNEDCAKVAEELIKEGYNPAILNLASRFSAGGGAHDGTSSQEESLCYASTLLYSLYQFMEHKRKYIKESGVPLKFIGYPMDIQYGGIYSKNVTFFRNGLNDDFTLKERPFKCGIVSVASLSNRESNHYDNVEMKYFKEDGYLTDEGIQIQKNKIRTIYRIALANGHDSLVSGAAGCGVFKMIPDEVASLFRQVLEEPEFKNRFKKIIFAIYEGKGSKRKIVGKDGYFKPFYDEFGK